jgi:predicted aspartyl protease
MALLVDQLPPEIAKQLHPDRRKNEEDYWEIRDKLLTQYQGYWIGFADGKVVASGPNPVTVLQASEASGLHPFFICVGREKEPCRIRRTTSAYDAKYPGEPLPILSVEFRTSNGSMGHVLEQVIPDTGADATVLPWPDCKKLKLTPEQGIQSLISGVAGSSTASLAFLMWVFLDGLEYPCFLQADFTGQERILGRDVLNRLRILFDGPKREVIVNP